MPRKSFASLAASTTAAVSGTQTPPPVLVRLLGGTLWLALQIPLQIIFSLWSLRSIIEAIGPDQSGAHRADNAVFQPARARHLRLPRAEGRSVGLPAKNPAAPPAGAVALILATWPLRFLFPAALTDLALGMRLLSPLSNLGGGLAYIGGYLLVPAGRGDIAALLAMP